MITRLFLTPIVLFCIFTQHVHAFTIMIDPAGDARTPGRTIEQHFERGITLQIAESIKKNLELNHSARVILTRVPGETIAPLQNAIFANRLNADLYVNIHCYHATHGNNSITIYHFLTNPITDLWATPRALTFYPYDQAHLYQVHTSKKHAEHLKMALLKNKQVSVHGVFGIPFAPLIGIKIPALAIEIGLRSKDEWDTYADIIAQGLV